MIIVDGKIIRQFWSQKKKQNGKAIIYTSAKEGDAERQGGTGEIEKIFWGLEATALGHDSSPVGAP